MEQPSHPKGSRAAILVLDALLLAAILAGTGVHRDAMRTVGKDTVPSIIAAQRIKAALADMDANAANELLSPPNTAPPSAALYDRRRIEASESLIVAAKNITYGDAEQIPIDTLQVSTGTYERLIQQALDFQDAGQADLSIRYYRHATSMMDLALLPAADALDRANDDVLEHTYKAESLRSVLMRALVLLVGLLTLAALAGSQLFLFRRTHRIVNPFLLVATVVTLWLTFATFTSFGHEEHHLKVAKEDAFTSIRALSRARALAYAANGDENLFLLDPLYAARYESAFFTKARALATLPAGVTPETVANGGEAGGFTGLLADELNNITFPGEREAALETLQTFERYLSIDTRVRELELAGKHAEAVALSTGTSEGQSDWAFAQFDHALMTTLTINQDAFDRAVADGISDVSNVDIEAAVAAIAIAILAVLGLAPRIREYQ